MDIEILGAHSTEIASAKPAAMLIDGVLALDAGSLCRSLPLDAQRKLKAILLTHCHYDHTRDIPFIGMNVSHHGSVDIYSTHETLETLYAHLVDGTIYPDFLKWPENQPALRFVTISPGEAFNIGGYSVLAVPVAHSVPTVGYQVSSNQGKTLFYTGDTGVGLGGCWQHVSPDLLITEVSLPARMGDWAREASHLTSELLHEELLQFRKVKGYLPSVLLVHLNPELEDEIQMEVAQVARELGANIALGREGMKIQL